VPKVRNDGADRGERSGLKIGLQLRLSGPCQIENRIRLGAKPIIGPAEREAEIDRIGLQRLYRLIGTILYVTSVTVS
jgi:hypothetical protein